MNELIGALFPLGVAAALSPMPLIALIIALFSKQRALNGLGFVLGSLIATAAITTITTILALALPSDPEVTIHPVKGTIHIVLGAAMVYYGIVIWHRRPKPGEPRKTPSWIARIESINPAKSVVFGMLLAALNVKNLPIEAVAGTHLAAAPSMQSAIVAGIIFVVLACGALATILIAALAFPTRTTAPLKRLRETLIDHNAIILTLVFVLAGTSMIGHAIAVI